VGQRANRAKPREGGSESFLSAKTFFRLPGASSTNTFESAIRMDYELGRSTRKCAKTGREFAAGESFFSVLMAEGSKIVRHDYAAEAWEGAPKLAVGWWKSQIPAADSKRQKPRWAPNDVMLQLFDELAEQPDRADMRYVLALLLLRRRVLRLEDTEQVGPQGEVLLVYCARRQTEYKVPVVMPDGTRAEEIQQELARLLLSDAA
jgi:hypothetical protein